MKTLTKILTKIFKKTFKKTMRALFQIDQVQPKAVLVLLLLAPVMLSSCEDFDYSFPEIADDAKPRHVYYKAGECESPFVATLPTDKTEYLRLDTPTLKGSPVACKNGNLEKSFSHWDITYSNSNGEHKPGDKIPFTRHGKYFNATAVWECMRETYDLDGGTGEIVPACKDPKTAYTLSDGRGKDGNFVTKVGYYLENWQVVDKGDTTLTQGATLALSASAGKAPDDDTKAMPKLKAVWKPVEVTVNFDGGGQTFQGSAPSSVSGFYDSTGGSPSVTLPNASTATTDYYTLASWKTKPNGSGATIASGNVTVKNLWQHVSYVPNDQTATLTLFAQWTGKPVTVKYDNNGGSGSISSGSGTYGDGFPLVLNLTVGGTPMTKPKYDFGGWCKTAGCTATVYTPQSQVPLNKTNFVFDAASLSQPTLITTVYAKWKPIPVTSVTLNKNSVSIEATGNYTSDKLTATVLPSNAMNKAVTWSSDKPTIATVDQNGKVTAVSAGTATITVTTADGSHTATATVTVSQEWDVLGSTITVPTNGGTPITFPMNDGDNSNGMDDATGTINHKFAMSQTEVTYELWKKVYDWANKDGGTCVSATGQYCYTFANKGREGSYGTAGHAPTTAKHEPVTKVNWRDAVVWSNAYTEWYNAVKGGSLTVVYYTDGSYTTPLRTSTNGTVPNPLSGATAGSEDKPYIKASSNNNTDMANNIANGFRLPTSAEWEFAARLRKNNTNTVANGTPSGVSYPLSIDGTDYWFTQGDSASGATADYNDATETGKVAWYNKNSGAVGVTKKTQEVATKAFNALGIYDMSGNVDELCFDIKSGSFRVRRGGSWGSDAYLLQVGYVHRIFPNFTTGSLGFRVARTVP